MTQHRPTAVIVLAAGEGTRMKSALPKVLHTIGGRSLLGHAICAAEGLGPAHLAVVVRHERDRVEEHVHQVCPQAVVADQDEIKGTGRAAECGLDRLPAELSGTVLVTYGDVPLLETASLQAMVATHEGSGAGVTVMTARIADPTGYGRVLRDDGGQVVGIVEQKDATAAQRQIDEINSGIYAFDAQLLRDALREVGTDNAQGEKYLTDVVAVAHRQGRRVGAHVLEDLWQTEGVNDRVQLAKMGAELNRRILERHMRAGVTIVDPATTWIDTQVSIGPDSTILPGTQILGATTIGADVTIGPDTTLTDMDVRDGARIVRTHGSLSVVRERAVVGPFAYLRPGSDLGAKGKIGTFVETKNATIGQGSKIPHLSYVGDATIGQGTNIGAASVFVNYDGIKKARTTIGNHCRLGSDNMYVAPVTVGDGAYSGAGTTIRKDVPPGALAISVAPQRNVLGWVESHRAGTKAAEAASAARRGDGGTEPGDPPPDRGWALPEAALDTVPPARAGGAVEPAAGAAAAQASNGGSDNS